MQLKVLWLSGELMNFLFKISMACTLCQIYAMYKTILCFLGYKRSNLYHVQKLLRNYMCYSNEKFVVVGLADKCL